MFSLTLKKGNHVFLGAGEGEPLRPDEKNGLLIFSPGCLRVLLRQLTLLGRRAYNLTPKTPFLKNNKGERERRAPTTRAPLGSPGGWRPPPHSPHASPAAAAILGPLPPAPTWLQRRAAAPSGRREAAAALRRRRREGDGDGDGTGRRRRRPSSSTAASPRRATAVAAMGRRGDGRGGSAFTTQEAPAARGGSRDPLVGVRGGGGHRECGGVLSKCMLGRENNKKKMGTCAPCLFLSAVVGAGGLHGSLPRLTILWKRAAR